MSKNNHGWLRIDSRIWRKMDVPQKEKQLKRVASPLLDYAHLTVPHYFDLGFETGALQTSKPSQGLAVPANSTFPL